MLQGSSHILVLSFLLPSLSCFTFYFITIADKMLIKILQMVTFEIRAILGVTTRSKNCC